MRRISLRLAGAILAPAVLVAFLGGLIVAGVLDFAPKPAMAQPASVPVLSRSKESPFVAVADEVIPTVVNISAEKTIKHGQQKMPEFYGPFEEFFRDFSRNLPEIPFEEHRNALGSGVVIDPAGYIVTNNHVVAGFDNVVVKLSDGTEFRGKDVGLVGRDQKTDVAVLKVNSDKPLPAIRFGDASGIKVGDWAIAVGNAFGLQSTVTVGVISAKGRSGIPLPEGPSYQDFIQTDASVNPGNSGGPLVNIQGELIGINSAIRSPVGASVGIGFAVPVDMVKSVANQLIEHGRVIRGFLGVRPQPVTESIRKALGLKDTKGVLISEVVDDMPAEKAGLKEGDVIVQVNGKEIKDVPQFRRDIADVAPGAVVKLTIVRNGKRLERRVKLAEFPESSQAAVPPEKEHERPFGLSVRNLTREEQKDAKVEGGVLVESVESGSIADDAGIERGDIILRIGKKKIEDLSSFNKVAQRLAKTKEVVLFRIERSGIRMFVGVEPKE
ncbi:hypothetical protein CH330_07455 [candidate division WOR-3 bacterium JGI_Cruoil_03_51_56]|uniref:PDZ domain-containing protein n=1 Tax=candidate division WOR-3 bacterium JGI_Cruoil_03_51_56 TaxID=1973747 RepID=A0A235BRM4_UNCW3|nr:MAG: hypothetical protein CH330_07455 [candidate division WOR-3 bacterium JGI_Cruoil_03_51_56]